MPGPARVPSETPLDPIPSPVRSVLTLFDEQLAGVAFPGLDAGVLSTFTEEVCVRARALEDARAALEAARADLEHSQNALLAQARKGLAYAHVFAESDPELTDALAAIRLPATPTKRSAKGATKTARKKAPKKAGPPAANRAELPLEQRDDESLAPPKTTPAMKETAEPSSVKAASDGPRSGGKKARKASIPPQERAAVVEPAIEYDEDESPPLLEEVSL